MNTSAASSSTALLKEILNLDKAELVFQRLLEAVEAHSSELAAVRRDLSTKAGNDEVCGMCNQMQSRLDALDRRVATTEAAVTIPEISHDPDHVSNLPSPRWRRDGAAGFTVGEAVEANGQALQSVIKQLSDKAGKDELAAKGEELEGCVREREKALRQWGVGRDFADSLGRAQRGLAGQMLAVEGLLATKLDRSEMDNMQAACAKVSTVSDFLDEAANRVSTLEAGLKEEEGKRNEGELKTQAALKDTRKELTRKADGDASRAVAGDLADLRTAFAEETSSGRKQIRNLRQGTDKLKEAVGRVSQLHDERLRDVEALLERAATKSELHLKADARHTEDSLRGLRADCATRARQSSLSLLEATVSSLEEEHAKTRKASDLSGRFVDWFSSRGQAYEHNLAAVEKHIENLATRSVGARASPATALGAARASRFDGDRYGSSGNSSGGNRAAFPSPWEGVAGGGGLELGDRVPYSSSVRFTPP